MLKSKGAFRAVRFTDVVCILEGPIKGGSTVLPTELHNKYTLHS